MDSQQPGDSSVIAEALLALAKDSRYIQYCQSLIDDVLLPYCSRRNKPADFSLCLASLLYAATVVWRTGTTLGMEACGLRYKGKRSAWFALASTALWIYALKTWSAADNDAAEDGARLVSASPQHNETSSSLRGDERRRYHERQRQAMQRRALEAESMAATPTNNTPNPVILCSPSPANRWRLVWRRIASKLVQALSVSNGPHALPQNMDNNSDTPSVWSWAIRLHLASFLLTGRFPTWMHRLWGLELQQASEKERRLAEQPSSSYRVVGMLIVLQTASELVKLLANKSISSYMTRRQGHGNRTVVSPGRNARVEHADDTSLPAVMSTVTCGICRAERTHPAAPSSCGHVFCWRCLYHWVSSVRPECPLCRSSCRPQDLVALHHYAPH